MNGWITLAGNLAILILLGSAIGFCDRRKFAPRWLVVSAVLLAVNDIILTSAHGFFPDLIGGEWLWQGKLLAFGATVAIAALPSFGWSRSGLRFSQQPGSMKTAIPVALLYCAYVTVIALIFPQGKTNTEEVAFQLTMPGIEEETFWRGLLLLSLDQAFTGRKRFLGVDWSWGAVLACFMFGLGHAFSFSDEGFSFDMLTLALTALPSFVAVWLRLRTGSVLLPILLHNFGNTLSLFL